MTPSRLPRVLLLPALLAAVALLSTNEVLSQKAKPKEAKGTGRTAEELLKSPPKPEKAAALPPATLPLQVIKGEHIALVGNSTAERMNLFGHFEAMLQTRFADKELAVRNFAWPADEVGVRQRPSDYTRLDDPLAAFGPDTFVCFFGWNESFAGKAGVDKFKADYGKFIDDFSKQYPRDQAGSPPRFVLVSPLAFEPTGDPLLPAGETENANLKLYADATAEVAKARGLPFVDLYGPTLAAFTAKPGMQFTINGVHVNEAGDREVGGLLDKALFGAANPGKLGTSEFEKLRAAINDKSWVHAQDYRMVNGWYVYGGRRTFDTETFPLEYVKNRNMVAVRDRYVWDIAQGKQVADKPDDSKTGDLFTPPTRFGQVKYSESPDGPRILPPQDLLKTCTVPPGFEIKLFADEKQFPELAKPVQLGFDNKGRLWVSTMPSYPQWKPGDPKPADKLLILEDTDGDGKADKCTTFYDKLHCPTGFEFWNGGVLVVDQPRLIFLKDTDGDGKADEVVHLIDGWATQDTHHTVGAFEYGHGGQLHMLEGVSMSTALETPWGPFRNFGSSGSYILDPRTQKVRHFNTPGYGNPWCYVFNEWGQGFCGDGTGARQHWDTLLSGAQYQGRKGVAEVFNTEGMRPVVGSEFLVTRQFPDDVQGQFIYACVINTNGMPRWTFADDGAGYKGTRVRHDPKDPKTAFDLIKSTEKHFRPVDPKIGPDGALWFGDWANPLIGHMQYSQRDPNRDHANGRIYRLVYKDKPLLKPVTQFGKSVAELLEQFREYEWRTRYHARAELRDRPTAEVVAAVKAWVGKLDPADKAFDRLRCEALYTLQSHHAVDAELLKQVLAAKTPDARAVAAKVAADERERLPMAFDMLKAAAKDESSRVRAEACRGLSFFPTGESAAAVLGALKMGADPWLQYVAEAALGATQAGWAGAYVKGDVVAKDDATGKKVIEGIMAQAKVGAQAVPDLQILLGKDQKSAEERNKAMASLATMRGGNPDNGKAVFRRNCIACHKVFNEGADYGPQMDGNVDGKGPVGKRLAAFKIVESIIDPNAEVDAKYLTVRVTTAAGKTITGLVVSDTTKTGGPLVIFDGKDRITIAKDDVETTTPLKQSSMPEGLAATMSPGEFLDVVAFLKSLNR